ncbi:MAG: hypothetical protein H8D67_12715 [Deltaproteobacteria bacterium]|nr:hypothetical protein [Deltaproteobacteria bacterium]
MELYLAVNLPDGKRIRLRDKWTDKIDYKVAPVLYPNKPTVVPDEVGERLLEQDPHLVSKTQLKQEKVENEFSPVAIQPSEPTPEDGRSESELVLLELADKDFSKMAVADIIEYGKKLGIEIPFNIKRGLKEQMLEDRCAELVK